MRGLFGLRSELACQVTYVPGADGLWFGVGGGSARDFAYLPVADVVARAKPLP
jgi:hypothetical protein